MLPPMPPSRLTRFFERLLFLAIRRPLPPAVQFAIATAAIILVTLVRVLFVTVLLPWLLFMPAILLLALAFGRGVGLYATFLSAVLAGWSIAGSSGFLGLDFLQWVASGAFLVVAVGIVLLASELRASFARADHLMQEAQSARDALAAREAFLSSVLASSGDCIVVLDREANVLFVTENGRRALGLAQEAQVRGSPWQALWQEVDSNRASGAIAAASEGHRTNFAAPARICGGALRWWDVSVSPILRDGDQSGQVLLVARDITAKRAGQRERNRLARVVENSADFIGVASLDQRVEFLNPAGCNMVGLSPEAACETVMLDYIWPGDVERLLEEVLPAIRDAGSWSGEMNLRHFRTGERIPVHYLGFRVQEEDGSLIGYGAVMRDFSEVERARVQQRLLNNELSHRLKNVLTMVQAIAAQSIRQAETLEDAGEAVSARLVALGRATDILTATSWQTAELQALVATVLRPHGALSRRIKVDGPSVAVNPRAALALALAIHELTTNAIKYGALSNETGEVSLKWWIAGGAIPADQRLLLTWRETGGPYVTPPARRGFGSVMIERSLKAYFRAEVMLDFRPEGIVLTLNAPLAEAIATDRAE
ncbi:PAS domain S-box protein [Sphingomonas desiccabilis]|uniref:histidine kinase n=2 Tax=Sphingomonas desiccabilis TaxID=429134 RepID=A0A4Q2J0X5_9SPHN|nr:PAS domain S-box protein [Sphingomonas desiccabilis]